MSRLNVANFRHPDGTADNLNLDSSGRVGIGTTTPSQKLHVASNASTYIQVQNTGDSVNAYYGVDTAAAWVGSSTNHPLVFHTNNTERARIDSSGNLRFNSGYGSVATAYGCRAWCNANTMSANTFNGSGNVSSITDNGSGDYTVNFTTSMPDTGYAVVAMGFEVGSTGTSDGYFTVERATNYSDSMATGSVTVKTNSGGDRNLNLIVVR